MSTNIVILIFIGIFIVLAIIFIAAADALRSWFVSLTPLRGCRLVRRIILPDVCAGRCPAGTNCVAVAVRRYGLGFFGNSVQAQRCGCVPAALGGGPRQLPNPAPGPAQGGGNGNGNTDQDE